MNILTRRQFITRTAIGLGLLTVTPSLVLGGIKKVNILDHFEFMKYSNGTLFTQIPSHDAYEGFQFGYLNKVKRNPKIPQDLKYYYGRFTVSGPALEAGKCKPKEFKEMIVHHIAKIQKDLKDLLLKDFAGQDIIILDGKLKTIPWSSWGYGGV